MQGVTGKLQSCIPFGREGGGRGADSTGEVVISDFIPFNSVTHHQEPGGTDRLSAVSAPAKARNAIFGR